VSSSITIRPADDLISRGDRLLHHRRCVGGRNRIPELCGRGPPRNIMVDVGRRGFATGEKNNQTEPTENSTKRRHGRERATNRSRNSRSYEDWSNGVLRGDGVPAYRRIGVSAYRRIGGWGVGGSVGRWVGGPRLLPRRGTKRRHPRHYSTTPSLTRAPLRFRTSESACRNGSVRELVAMAESTRSAKDGSPSHKDRVVPNAFENGISAHS